MGLPPLSIPVPGFTTADPHPVMYAAWNEGRVVILATLAEGPNAGMQVICATGRSELKSSIKRVQRGKMWRDQHFMDSLRGAIRAQILRGVAKLDRTNDQDFMGDLAIMMAVKLGGGGEKALDDTGLFSLLLAVSEDQALPWMRRGFLSAGDLRAVVAGVG